jgi:hypothetical protein
METVRLAGRLPVNVLDHEATTARYFLKYNVHGGPLIPTRLRPCAQGCEATSDPGFGANLKNNLEEVVSTLFKGYR